MAAEVENVCNFFDKKEDLDVTVIILEALAYKICQKFSKNDCYTCIYADMFGYKQLALFLSAESIHLTFVWDAIVKIIACSFETDAESEFKEILILLNDANVRKIAGTTVEVVRKFFNTKILLYYYKRGNIRKAKRFLRQNDKDFLHADKLSGLISRTHSTYPEEFEMKKLQHHLLAFISRCVKSLGRPYLYRMVSKIKGCSSPPAEQCASKTTRQSTSSTKATRNAKKTPRKDTPNKNPRETPDKKCAHDAIEVTDHSPKSVTAKSLISAHNSVNTAQSSRNFMMSPTGKVLKVKNTPSEKKKDGDRQTASVSTCKRKVLQEPSTLRSPSPNRRLRTKQLANGKDSPQTNKTKSPQTNRKKTTRRDGNNSGNVDSDIVDNSVTNADNDENNIDNDPASQSFDLSDTESDFTVATNTRYQSRKKIKGTSKARHSTSRKISGSLREQPSCSKDMEIDDDDSLPLEVPDSSIGGSKTGSPSRPTTFDDNNDKKTQKRKRRLLDTTNVDGESLRWSDDDNDAVSLETPTKSKKRLKFSSREVEYIKAGIESFGVGQWAKIRKSYPFHPCRTNVNLKDKYRNMIKYAKEEC